MNLKSTCTCIMIDQLKLTLDPSLLLRLFSLFLWNGGSRGGGEGAEGVRVHITHTPPLSVSLSRHDSLSLCLSTSHFCSCDNPLSVCLSVCLCLSVSVSLSLSLSLHTVEFAMKNHPGGKEKEKIQLGIFPWRLTMPTPKVLCKITSHSGHSKTATTNKQCN